ncbi:hypothetical protein DVH24_008641 [Malus domestica]|uniref:Uncharacterized protein n=1 Tax=Malus domestica TaxID=3750 RepID=A0A498JSC2_MALDO|nr:hypothetical protein DVH24_008641 [Malus domestica]
MDSQEQSLRFEFRKEKKIRRSRTQCTRLPLYAGSGRGECRLALPHLWRGCSQVSNPRPTAHGRRHLPSHQVRPLM